MDIKEALKVYFGYDSFKPGQEEILDAIMSGKDVLAIMPTGAGKSVCYQIPALLFPGVTFVISPLISLMQDQVKALNETGIRAGYINSSLTDAQISKVYAGALEGAYKILYIAPERLESREFIDFTEKISISMVTVDEAHCISQWGQDFRPGYLKIVDFIDRLSSRPVVSAFTATATEEVKTDISCMLKLNDPSVVVTGFDRENLYYDVKTIKKKDDFVLEYIRQHPEDSGIIYCATRKNVDALYELLSGEKVSVARYHAGMSSKDRKTSQDDFIYDRTPVMVATNAFGMGIDKSNVRFVIHYNMPQSMENYYQEAGRAGRDGEQSQCILLFSPQDIMINKFLLEHKEFADLTREDAELIRQRDEKRLQIIERYCKTTDCFRNYILGYFGEKRLSPCGNCGNCNGEFTETDMTEEAKQIINCVWEARGRYGLNIVLGTLLGANRARLKELGATEYRTYGILAGHSESDLRLLINRMILDGYLYQTPGKYSMIRLGNIDPLKDPDEHILIRKHKDREFERRTEKSNRKSTDALTRTGYELFDVLRKLRLSIAREEGLPPYIIFNDRTLVDMSVKAPLTRTSMLNVSGVGEAKLEKYGDRFIDAIKEFLEYHPDSVTGMVGGGPVIEGDSGHRKTKKKPKEPFFLNPEDGNKFEYKELSLITEIRDELNRITSAENVKHLFGTDIFRVLVDMGYVEEKQIDGRNVQVQTEKGLEKGITLVEKISKLGNAYMVLMYPPEIQKELVDHYTETRDPVGVSAPAETRALR